MSAGASFRSQAQMVGAIFEGSRPARLREKEKKFPTPLKSKSEQEWLGINEITNLMDSSSPLRRAWV